MPTTYPIATAGPREPKRARQLTQAYQAAFKTLVWGIEGEDGLRAATLAEAAALGSMQVDTLRRWLNRPEARAFLAREKRALLTWATSPNPAVLASIRDNGQNEAARVRAVMALEEISEPRQRRASMLGFRSTTSPLFRAMS